MGIRNENYIVITGWMINELALKPNELLVYALIHGFCQDGKSAFIGGIKYIMVDKTHQTDVYIHLENPSGKKIYRTAYCV